MGLVAAIRAWQPERGPFPAFADRCVSNHALLALEAACRRKHQLLTRAVSLDSPGPAGPESRTRARRPSLLDTLPANRDARTDPESRLLVREQLTVLLNIRRSRPRADRDRRHTRRAQRHCLAPLLGGTPKAASNVACRARRKLAAALPHAA